MTKPTSYRGNRRIPTDARIKSLLLSAEEMHQAYTKLAEQGVDTNAEPLIFRKKEGNKQLIYLGVHHSNKLERPDLGHITSAWDRFVDETKDSKRLVLIEGGLRPVEKNQATALHRWGEPGLLAYLSKEANIGLVSPEPSRKEELLAVTEVAGRDEAMYYYFARTLGQWQRFNVSGPFEEYISNYLNRYRELLKWDDYDFSIEHMVELYERKHKRKFDPTTATVGKDATPGYNPAATACSEYRNISIIRKILRLWQDGESMFILFGSGHLIVQEKALKELLK